MVDVLRSAYAVDFAFFRDDPAKFTRVQWYFCPEKHPYDMPFSHVFGSNLYYRDHLAPPPIGEQLEPHPWRGGLPPRPVSYGGLCGTEQQWQGASITDPIPLCWPDTQIPRCCSPPPVIATGGLAIGGTTALLAPCLPNPLIPATLQITAIWNGVGGGPPPCNPIIQNACLTNDGADQWIANGSFWAGSNYCFDYTWTLTCPQGPTPSLNVGPCPGTNGDPPCYTGLACFPCGDLLSYTSNPLELTFGPTDQTVSQWNYVISAGTADCLVAFGPCCEPGIQSPRYMTLSGGGFSGTYSADGQPAGFEWAAASIPGSLLPLASSMFCFASLSGMPPYFIGFQSDPGTALYSIQPSVTYVPVWSCSPFLCSFYLGAGVTVSLS